MGENRIEILKNLIAKDPANHFARYGLAMAYATAGDFAQAVEEYRQLIAADPNYVAAYYHGGQALERLGCTDEARQMYRRGIVVSEQIGDQHTRSELATVLE